MRCIPFVVLVALFGACGPETPSETGGGDAADTAVEKSDGKTNGNASGNDNDNDNGKTADGRDALTAGLAKLIEDAGKGAAELPLQDRLVALLESEGIGDVVTRQQAAEATIASILDQVQLAGGGGVMGAQQRQAMRSIAGRLATSFRGGLTDDDGKRKDHTGVVVGAAADFRVPEGHVKISWATLGDFEYKEGMDLPPALSALEGKSVGVAGYMVALGQYENIREFVLVESQWSCCFGIPPDVNQVIVVKIPQGEEGLDLVAFPLVITGTFEVGEEYEDGYVTSLYRLNVDDVQEMD